MKKRKKAQKSAKILNNGQQMGACCEKICNFALCFQH